MFFVSFEKTRKNLIFHSFFFQIHFLFVLLDLFFTKILVILVDFSSSGWHSAGMQLIDPNRWLLLSDSAVNGVEMGFVSIWICHFVGSSCGWIRVESIHRVIASSHFVEKPTSVSSIAIAFSTFRLIHPTKIKLMKISGTLTVANRIGCMLVDVFSESLAVLFSISRYSIHFGWFDFKESFRWPLIDSLAAFLEMTRIVRSHPKFTFGQNFRIQIICKTTNYRSGSLLHASIAVAVVIN